ncbi:hypothetical protein L1987_52819 [Smallanthus sonchifolius]|uniref:Uncharacterized protein n=1 Tax=Smallanthus sonchifolius TaxID=185202 RepID=A0ACB9ETV3_9ASTR|nr:hypothetical protein L1987_52819 [Smallanthus sonchifolius]
MIKKDGREFIQARTCSCLDQWNTSFRSGVSRLQKLRMNTLIGFRNGMALKTTGQPDGKNNNTPTGKGISKV